MVTGVTVATALLVTVKLAVVAPAATVTDAGTVAAFVLLLASITSAPPACAPVESLTVPVLPAPPVTDAGFKVNETRGGLMTSVTILDAPLGVAVMFTDVTVVTGLVLIWNVAVVAPAATVTDAGIVAAFVLLLP